MKRNYKTMEAELASVFRNNVIAIRKHKQLTQQEASKLADMERVRWTEMERGRSNPSVLAIARVCLALKVEPHELFDPRTLEQYQ